MILIVFTFYLSVYEFILNYYLKIIIVNLYFFLFVD